MAAYEAYDYLGPDCKTMYPVVIVYHPMGLPNVPTDVPGAVVKRRPDLTGDGAPACVREYYAVPKNQFTIAIYDPESDRIIDINQIGRR